MSCAFRALALCNAERPFHRWGQLESCQGLQEAAEGEGMVTDWGRAHDVARAFEWKREGAPLVKPTHTANHQKRARD